MKKGFRRRVSDALGWTRPSTVFMEMPSFNFETIRSRHVHLTDKQILLLQHMINNYEQHDIPICECDVQRVLEQCNAGSEG